MTILLSNIKNVASVATALLLCFNKTGNRC